MLTCIDTHSNKMLEQELEEDLQIEEASLIYHVKVMQENYNVINSTIVIIVALN